ncbi:MAG: asparagine synthase (glutamine-hydrolyzing) [Sphingomonas sp.]|nr:asparagine synthase (glutamine-hydrolyzing) [Sphingomonas sp.]
MCGIAGWYRRAGRPVEGAVIGRQCDRLLHRGPDDAGYLIDGDFGFGMRRLSIIDIDGGHQPIVSPDGRFAIVCNGEIVNHPELRREIGPKYAFKTRSDVETLLAAFISWGDDAWLRAEGMYAAAIWDRATRTLRLVRDPLGIKPLFVSEQQGGIAFASEIPSLREIPGYEFDVDEAGVHDFFCFGHVLGPRSIFRQVRAVPPGHALTIGEIGEATLKQYWKPRIQTLHGRSEAEWIEETRERVLGTVGRHMLSDVPVGAFLSGGIDSGAVAAAMTRSAGRSVIAFTAGFPNSKIDETAAASRIAEHLGCKHIVLPIEPETAADVLPAVQAAFDEPSAANSAIPLWYLSRTAAEHVKVVLCGEGGDELFLGYNRQRWAERMRRWAPVVKGISDLLPLDRTSFRSRKLNYLLQHAERFRDGARLKSGFERFFAAVTITPPKTRRRIYAEDFRRRHEGDFAARAQTAFPDGAQLGLSQIEQFMLGDLAVHMPASLLQRLDRASMAHSLEARVPFLSHHFVDWALTMPSGLKLRGNTGKYVLREAVKPWLSPETTKGRKLGFQMPLADWFVGGFSDFAYDAWMSSGAADAGFLDAGAVNSLFEEHRRGQANHGRILYAIAMFSCWWNEQRQSQRSQRPATRQQAALA